MSQDVIITHKSVRFQHLRAEGRVLLSQSSVQPTQGAKGGAGTQQVGTDPQWGGSMCPLHREGLQSNGLGVMVDPGSFAAC